MRRILVTGRGGQLATGLVDALPAPMLHAISTADYPTKAAWPADGRMDGTSLRETFGVSLPRREQGLTRAIRALHAV